MAQAAEEQIEQPESKVAHFSSDGQLLSELGERLIANPRVALAELIKNAYDADATRANVWITGEKRPELHVLDDGYGMTEAEFLSYWMRIATSSKLQTDKTRKFNRYVTGAKGVGRFAVRYLGYRLTLITVAQVPGKEKWQRLTAEFDWKEFRAGEGLDQVDVPYTVTDDATKDEEGTHLIIQDLRTSWDEEKLKNVTDQVLDIVSPPFAPIQTRIKGGTKSDPGFSLLFSEPGADMEPTSATKGILERHVARVEIKVKARKVTLDYEWRDPENKEARPKKRDYTYQLPIKNLVGDFQGEVRWYPKRKEVFKGLPNMDGRKATKWLRDHGGVRIVDRNFRVPPYGEPGNDWLQLSETKASNVRSQWGSQLTEHLFPFAKIEKQEHLNPLLSIPGNHQLVGAVYVKSHRPDPTDLKDADRQLLQPMMDRQGFLVNEGFKQLRDVIRGAIELFGIIDREESTRKKVEQAKERTRTVKQELAQAIQRVERNPAIAPQEKKRLVETYHQVEKRVDEMDKAHEQARKAVESLSMLGVLAGFMTHEATVMLRSTKHMLQKWEKVPKESRDEEFEELLAATKEAWQQIQSHIDYARMYILHVREWKPKPFPVKPQVNVVTKQLQHVWGPRNVEVENFVPDDVSSPSVPLSVYSGILLNLFSNALKAVFSLTTVKERKVRIEASNTGKHHILRVSDSGIGVPEELQDRIFDPLFTTTAEEGPLGSGLGLGLHIVKRMLEEFKASIALVPPTEAEFTTCFEVRFPR